MEVPPPLKDDGLQVPRPGAVFDEGGFYGAGEALASFCLHRAHDGCQVVGGPGTVRDRSGFGRYFGWTYRGLAMTFGEAIEALKVGEKVQRDGWNGRGMWLGLQRPDAHSKMGLPYIYMSTVNGKLVPWLASQTDMLSEDGSILGEKT